MNDTSELTTLFLDRLPAEVRDRFSQLPRLGETLERLVSDAVAAWPDFAVDASEFVRFMADRVAASEHPGKTLSDLRTADLYLGLGCLMGESRAVSAFKSLCFPEIRMALKRMDLERHTVEDVQQMTYEKVFVCEPPTEPRILQYSGRGDLRTWVRVVAVRIAQNLIRRHRKEQHFSDRRLADHLGTDEDQELRHLKRLYRPEFREAFRHALGTLTVKERNILRYRMFDELSVDRIASVYRVHRMTVTRWMSAIRRKLLDETRVHLVSRLGVLAGEVDSLIRLCQSQLDASVRRFLEVSSGSPAAE